jgi:membrane-bound metal-dependent hydrolase YbcI (DUF457 family)
MPSPLGHLLCGVAIGWCGDRFSRPAHGPSPAVVSPWSRFALTCALLAALPDLDLLYPAIASLWKGPGAAAGAYVHRQVTHSVGATILVMIIAATVTGWVTRRAAIRTALVCGLAYGSHIVMDWMGFDRSPPRGIRALWPFSDAWFISDWDLFAATERRDLFSGPSLLTNLRAAAQEIAVMGPFAAAAWWLCHRPRRQSTLRAGTSLPPSALDTRAGKD